MAFFLSRKTVFAALAVCILVLISYYHYLDLGSVQHSTLPEYSTEQFLVIDNVTGHRRVLSTVNPLDGFLHSKTLGVASRLYVIQLPGREDRRTLMESLQKAMDITFTWHNATDMHSPIISEIQRRVRHTREENKKDHQLEMEYPTFADDVTSEDFLQPGDISGSELWFLPPSAPLALPPVPDDMGDNGGRSPPELACWHSHFEVLRKIADGDDDVALIFEDDIDMEWDLERRLRYLWRFLPNKWDLVFIGYCLGRESEREPLPGTSYLYPSTYPWCSHAYAVSKKSAARLVRFLRSPLFAYTLPIDEVYALLNTANHIDAFSVYPPIVLQSSTTPSDVSGGMGIGQFEGRQFFLMDSALERVRLWEASKQGPEVITHNTRRSSQDLKAKELSTLAI